ncbi:MAG: ABC transporter permease [Acidimicrobiales bacterium]|nr:ABC transporter permease [Acidimicrobiales bacterium]RZV42321.1 MAG: ABC transporter permease [Acidimicrobiales bacterium]
MSMFKRLSHQVSYDLMVFRRNPAATFFTLILPLIFLFIFTSIFGNETLNNGAKVATLYVPGILSLALISATTVNLAITMVGRRERGMLKRVRGTPIPPWVFVVSQGIAGFVLSVLMTIIITFIGWLVFEVSFNWETIPALLISLIIGAACFSAMGLGLTSIIPSEDAAPAVTNAIMLPLYFISDVFIPAEQIPDSIGTVANIFPIKHQARALQDHYNPFIDGVTWPWEHWLVILAWGAFGLLVTLKSFRWTPQR